MCAAHAEGCFVIGNFELKQRDSEFSATYGRTQRCCEQIDSEGAGGIQRSSQGGSLLRFLLLDIEQVCQAL